jgi:hypothetical protein
MAETFDLSKAKERAKEDTRAKEQLKKTPIFKK